MDLLRGLRMESRGMSFVRMAVLAAAFLLSLTPVFVPSACADDAGADSMAVQRVTPGSMGLTVTVADGVAVTTPSQAGAYLFKISSSLDSSYALRSATYNPVIRRVDTTYSDTIALTPENTTANPTTDTTRKVLKGDTTAFILFLTNLGNSTDSFGLSIDTAVVDGYGGLDTMFTWSIHYYDSRGVFIGKVHTRGRDTGFIRLAAGRTETFAIKVYADSNAFDTSSISFTFTAYAANGNARKFAMRAYRGLNGETYGGDGHDSISLFVQLKPLTILRVSKADTVFSQQTLGRGTSDGNLDDTQHYVPGAIVAHTLWFDNDDSNTIDTQIVIEEWIDTRYVRFDSAGVGGLGAGQAAAAGAYVNAKYGNIFVDSGMPTNATGSTFDVRVDYYVAGVRTLLTADVPGENVGRIRWTISRVGGTKALLGAHNSSSGDASNSSDSAPLAIGAATDSDLGYVRYSVVIRTGAGRPDSGTLVGSNPVGISDSAYLDPDTKPAERASFVGAFTVQHLPRVLMAPDTQFAQKAQQSGGDTFFYACRVANYGNAQDSIALTGTTPVSGAIVTFLRDIGSIGVFDGFEQKIDTFLVSSWTSPADTIDILAAVFVPNGYVGTDSAFIRVKSARNLAFYDTALTMLKVIGTSQVTPDTGQPSLVGVGDTISFTVALNIPPTEDTIIISIGPDTTIVTIDSTGAVTTTDSSVKITYDSQTGILTVTLLDTPPSDTYTWSITVLDVESGVISVSHTDSGTFVIDTVPPFFTDSNPARVLAIDTALTGTDTTISIRLLDTGIGDKNTGIDSLVITIRDTAGAVVRTDTIDPYQLYQFPFDTTGAYTVQIIAIDMAGNTVALGDSLAVSIPLRRFIDLVAADKSGTKQSDDIAKGLNAQGIVFVTDAGKNLNSNAIDRITVIITTDVDLVGIPLELDETLANSGLFTGAFGFTNGVSNENAKKIKVRDGSPVTATYDADGVGPIAGQADMIVWQGKQIKDLEHARTWPNPFNHLTDPCVYIQNLPADPGMVIDIYNLNGEKLHTLRVGQGITASANQNLGCWDVRNSRGQMISAGTYIYVVRPSIGGLAPKVGKMTIVH